MNADEMFAELGFHSQGKNTLFGSQVYHKKEDGERFFKGSCGIEFDLMEKEFTAWDDYDQIICISPELHLAIHQKMKELGWIE